MVIALDQSPLRCCLLTPCSKRHALDLVGHLDQALNAFGIRANKVARALRRTEADDDVALGHRGGRVRRLGCLSARHLVVESCCFGGGSVVVVDKRRRERRVMSAGRQIEGMEFSVEASGGGASTCYRGKGDGGA